MKNFFVILTVLLGTVPVGASSGAPTTDVFFTFLLKFVGMLVILYGVVVLTGAIGKAYRKKHGDIGLGAAPPDREKEAVETMRRLENGEWKGRKKK